MTSLPSPEEFRKFQIANYSEMMLKPRSFKHKIFRKKRNKTTAKWKQ